MTDRGGRAPVRRIRVSLPQPTWPALFRQTPAGAGVWGECSFVAPAAPGADEPDYWLVFEGLPEPEDAQVAPGRTIFVTAEPEAKRWYQPGFLAQFGLVVTPQRRIDGLNVVHAQPALPWHVGIRRMRGHGGEQLDEDVAVLGYDDLRTARPEKTRELSVVCSAKDGTDGQRLRLSLVERLQGHFGARLDWFGRGIRPIEDKWDAVAPYRFHLSLENTAEPDYWSEKLSDAYLGGAFPLYWGCPNIANYFAADSFLPIDPADVAGTIALIERVLSEGITPAREAAVARARTQVLERYNLFPTIAALLERCPDGDPRTVRLRPEREFVPRQPLWRRAAGRARRAVRAHRR
jgi:hypothetical protein